MVKRSRFTYRFFAVGLATLFICISLMPDTGAYASRRHPPARHYRANVRPLLPLGFALLAVAGMEYYYHRGIYYRQLPDRYIETPPPTGAVVVQLPPGHITFQTGGDEYYYYGNVYYKRAPRGYTVVAPPYEASSTDSITKYQTASTTLEQVKVTVHMLNVRSGPGMDHPIISQVPGETTMEVHGNAPAWFFVKLPSGEFGWVMEKFTVSKSVPKSISNPVPAEG
ncbi:MAG: SH3 domain-containing protein [Syntrophobacterales bacterium]|nr:MAG: SH3 domain-containing protein [Syntrophobacterales bacterium]